MILANNPYLGEILGTINEIMFMKLIFTGERYYVFKTLLGLLMIYL